VKHPVNNFAVFIMMLLGLMPIDSVRSETKVEVEETRDLPDDLTTVGLRELLDLDLVVTSPGKREQTVAQVSSALYVLTRDEIARSGAVHVADALRLIPGVNVARVSSTQWAVSIRGFNQVYANKLLVLIDGVSVFNPFTNGVYWETLDLPLQDVERVEVIRGPGATLWGVNAVNGVINIITRNSKDTQGTLINAGGGLHQRAFTTVRHGTKLDESTTARISGRVTSLGENELIAGGDGEDDYSIGSVDARLDTNLENGGVLTVVGRGFAEEDQVRTQTPILQPPFVDSTTFSGVGRWTGGHIGTTYQRTDESGSAVNITGSVLYLERESNLISLNNAVYEVDGSHLVPLSSRNDLMYGGSVRLFDSEVDGSYAESTDPSKRSMHRINWFVQDEIDLVEDCLKFTVGSKFEQNVSTGFEYLPSARLLWTPNSRNSVWGAVSRAVAPPSLVFEDVRFPVATIPGTDQQPGTVIQVVGSRDVVSETVFAYELGYRSKVSESVSADFATFYNVYDNVLSVEQGVPFFGSPPLSNDQGVIVPLEFGNGLSANSVGFEATIEFRPISRLTLIGGYAYLKLDAKQGTSTDRGNYDLIQDSSPRHTAVLRANVDVTDRLQTSVTGRYVDTLATGRIPSYIELDANVAWKVAPELQFTLTGQNLLDASHQEFVGNLFGPPPIAIRRALFAGVTYSF
jgi:iron complex outermembrane recepter protein